MNIESQKRLTGRLRRVAGQVRALEQAIRQDEPEKVINQMLASIAGLKASLRVYLHESLLNQEKLTKADRELLGKLVNRVD